MLLRKMLRDLKNNAAQFLAIFLMIFLGVFIFSGMTSIGQGMKLSLIHIFFSPLIINFRYLYYKAILKNKQ